MKFLKSNFKILLEIIQSIHNEYLYIYIYNI
jgi:hypothetical protein